MSKEDDEFVMIEKYVNNTHASTHRHYRLEIEEVRDVLNIIIDNGSAMMVMHW